MSFFSLSGSNLTYEFSNGITLFQGLHFSFAQKTYGLVGSNGVGKTTFLKLLSGELSPSKGSISIHGKLSVLPQIHQRLYNQESTQIIGDILDIQTLLLALTEVESGNISQEVLEAIGDRWNILEQVQTTFQTLGIEYLSLSRPASQLSGGELVKVHLAKVLLSQPTIVLLDEPTNNLDYEGRQVLYQFIKTWKHCLIVVSHDRELLFHVENIVELSNQGLQMYGGNYEFYQREREKEAITLDQKLTTAKQDQKKQKADLEQSMQRQQRRMAHGQRQVDKGGIPKIMASGLKRKAQATLSRIKDVQESRLIQAQIEVKNIKDKIKERNIIQIDLPETKVHSKKEILEIKNFNFKYQDASQYLLASPLSFHLMGPKRVCIKGPNGAGKSTLIKLLLQSRLLLSSNVSGETQGSILLKSDRVSHLDQNLSILGDKKSSLLEQFTTLTPHLTEAERRIRLGRFLFNQETTLKEISALSGGEKMRAALAFALFSEVPPELLILDEPTNNLDMDSIERIESALSHFQGAIIVVSHDTQFLENMGAVEVLELRRTTPKVI